MSDLPIKPDPELMQRRRRQLRRAAWVAAFVAMLMAGVFAAVGPSAWAALSASPAARACSMSSSISVRRRR